MRAAGPAAPWRWGPRLLYVLLLWKDGLGPVATVDLSAERLLVAYASPDVRRFQKASLSSRRPNKHRHPKTRLQDGGASRSRVGKFRARTRGTDWSPLGAGREGDRGRRAPEGGRKSAFPEAGKPAGAQEEEAGVTGPPRRGQAWAAVSPWGSGAARGSLHVPRWPGRRRGLSPRSQKAT